MKKFGQFCFSFVPVLLIFAIENIASFFFMGITGLINIIYLRASGIPITFSTLSNCIDYLWSSTDFSTYTMVIYALISIALYGLWFYSKYEGNFSPDFKTTFHPLMVFGIVLLVPGMQFLTSYLVSFVSAIFPSWLEAYEKLLESAGMDESLTVGMFCYSVLLAPVCEELICRGVTMHQAKKCLPFWLANLLQAFLFGFLHMNMLQGTYAFCLGLILGYVCEKGGSIYYSILLHMLFNFWGTVLSQFLYYSDTVFSFILWFLFGLITTLLGLFLFTLGKKKLNIRSYVLRNGRV